MQSIVINRIGAGFLAKHMSIFGEHIEEDDDYCLEDDSEGHETNKVFKTSPINCK